MQQAAKSQAAVFQKLAVEPRVLGTVFAGGVLSLSVVYAQVPVDHFLSRPLAGRIHLAGAEGSRGAPGKVAHPLLIEPLIRLKPWSEMKADLLSASAVSSSLSSSVPTKPAADATAVEETPVRALSTTSVVALQPLLASTRPASVHEGAEPGLSSAPVVRPEIASGPVGILAVPEAALVTTRLPGTLAAGNDSTAASNLAGVTPPEASEPVGKSPEGPSVGLASGLMAVASNGQPDASNPLQTRSSSAAVVPLSAAPSALAPAHDSASTGGQPVLAAVSQAGIAVQPASPALLPAKAPAAGLIGVADVAKGFDLGALKAPARPVKPKAPLAAARAPLAKAGKVGAGRSSALTAGRTRDRIEGDVIYHQAKVNLNDQPASSLSVRIGAGGDLSLRLGDLLSLYEPGMAPAVFARLSGSSAASEFVSFDMLRSAGIDIRYDAGNDQLRISSRD